MIKTIQTLYLFVLIFAPLAFGTRAAWSLAIVSAAVCAAFVLYLVQVRQGRLNAYEIPGILPLLLLAGYMVLQMVPLPAFLVQMISPETAKLYQETIGATQAVNWMPLSVNTKATLSELFRFGTCVLFYVLTVWLCVDPDVMKRTIRLVVFLAAGIAIFAILQYVLSNDRIYGFRTVPDNATPFGPYVYHNHFAGFMEMIFPASLCLFLYYRPAIRNRDARLRTALLDIFTHARIHSHVLFGFSAVLIGASVFVSYSRGGIISMGLATALLALLLYKRGRKGRKESGMLFVFIIIAVLLAVGWFGWDVIFERFSKIRNADGYIDLNRFTVWRDIMAMVADYPLFGTGFGTFVHVYPGYRSAEGQLLFQHAHNDYLELLTDGGIVAAGLAVWFLAVLVKRVFTTIAKRHERYAIYLFYGVLSGLSALAIHSVSDFNLHNGANAIYTALLAGLLVSLSHTRSKVMSNTLLKALKPDTFRPFVIPASGVAAVIPLFYVACVVGTYQFSKISTIVVDQNTPEVELKRMETIACRASIFDPLEATYAYGLGNIHFYLSGPKIAGNYYEKAIRLNPVRGEYLQRLGLALAQQGQSKTAETLLRAGMKRDIHTPRRYITYAHWLMSMGDKEKSADLLKTAIRLDPSRANTMACIDLMTAYRFTDTEMMAAIPEKPLPALCFAEFFDKKGLTKAADAVYRNIPHYLHLSKDPKAWYFLKLKTYFMKHNRIDDALHVMTQAIEQIPDSAKLRIAAGRVYQKAGITYRAEEEYRKARAVDS